MGAQNNQPDWGKMAEKFDIWLPQLASVGSDLLNALDAQNGDKILDLGSGTGEPALTLARDMKGEVDILGIDAAEGMVKVANKKVAEANLAGITFQTMPAEKLSFADNTFDRVLCRFGIMLFENPLQGLKEIHRVLKPGGRFAFAVWSTDETMLTLKWSHAVFKNRIDEEFHPPLAKVTSLGPPGVMEDLLKKAKYEQFSIEPITFYYEFPSFDAYWNAIESSDLLKMQYDALPSDQRHTIRDEVGQFARDFIVDGSLRIPHEYLLISGNKVSGNK